MKLGKKSYYKKRADALVSKIVRLKGKCDRCDKHKGVQLQAAHIVGRKNFTLRFDLMNILCLCASCHFWSHSNPDQFTDFWRLRFPNRRMYLDHNRNKLTKRTAKDYKELCEGLQKLWEQKQKSDIIG